MMKVELHCHTDGSHCADYTIQGVIADYKRAGYGAIVVTNHYAYKEYVRQGFSTPIEYAKAFLSWIEKVEKVGKANDIKIFYGMEVRLTYNNTEFMLYGFEKDFVLNNPEIYSLTQEQLFDLANKHNIFIYQTHPFRDGVKVGNPKFMHGVECFNGHYHHINNNKKASEFCKENNLVKVVGTDFHHDDQPITTAILVPNDINDSIELTKYIRENELETIEDRKTYINTLINYKKEKGINLKISNLNE